MAVLLATYIFLGAALVALWCESRWSLAPQGWPWIAGHLIVALAVNKLVVMAIPSLVNMAGLIIACELVMVSLVYLFLAAIWLMKGMQGILYP